MKQVWDTVRERLDGRRIANKLGTRNTKLLEKPIPKRKLAFITLGDKRLTPEVIAPQPIAWNLTMQANINKTILPNNIPEKSIPKKLKAIHCVIASILPEKETTPIANTTPGKAQPVADIALKSFKKGCFL